MSMVTPPQKKVARYFWSEDAKRFVQRALKSKNPIPAALLHNQLQEMTGYNSHVCWRFLDREYDIRRPGAGTRKRWDDDEVVEHAMNHGFAETAKKYGCTMKAVYCAVARKQRLVGHGHGQFSPHQLSKLLNVRYGLILDWIHAGVLEATPVSRGGKDTFLISDEQFRRFLLYATRNLISRRLPTKRIEFLSNYLYEGNHMDLGLLRTRESKKEEEAYRIQTSRAASSFPTSSD